GRHAMVRLRIEPVVDRNAVARAQLTISIHYGIAATVSEYRIEFRDQRAKGIGSVGVDTIERGGRVDIPEDNRVGGALEVGDGFLQQFVENADAARLYDEVV